MPINFKFYSGFSASDSVGKDGTYIYSENIDTTNPEYIKVSTNTKNILISNEKIDFLVPFDEPDRENFYYVKNNKIFDKDNQLVYEHGAGLPYDENNKIAFAINFTHGRDFYIWALGIDKEKNRFDGLSFYISPVYSGELYPQKSKLNYNKYLNNLHFLLQSGSLYISHAGINRININDFPAPYSLGLRGANFSNHSSGLKVFTRDGKVVFWNGQENGGIQDQYELSLNILSGNTLSGLDYIFASEGLFFLNGIIPAPIYYKNTSNYLGFEKFNFIKPKFGVLKVGNFIYSVTKTKKGIDLNVLGSNTVGSPINFSSILSKPWQDVISMIEWKGGVLLHYLHNDGFYGIDYFNFKNEEKVFKGEIITKEYIANSKTELKKAEKIKLFCDKLKEGEYLKIFASINNEDFEEIIFLNSESRWKNGFFEILNFNKEFHKIVFKLELKGNFKLYDFIFLDKIIR